jgi:serine/threonine-protein kinase RsbT
VPAEATITIAAEVDIVTARQKGRELAASLGFPSTDQTLIATAISEVARNILVYAKHGEIFVQVLEQEDRRGLLIVARDRGPGIPNLELAMRDGYSTTNSLGMGLPGAKRLMDEFDLASVAGQGTTVTLKKWVR